MAELINERDTLNEGRKKINKAITHADEAKHISEQADTKATEALNKSESTQEQLNQVVIDGDSSVEAAQARVDEKGQTHSTLKDRIDDGFTKVNTQLAKKANQSEVDRLGDIKADKAYVENIFTNLDGLEIKGGFDTLVDLENAYPNGTLGLYVVDDYLYGWNGNEWKVVKELEVMPWADFLTEQDEEWVI